ncbi:DUF4232 domain-containing protein [Streptomyces orinoci]|uniref:DUF4232 domain-containing protein n=1 Tax=Streptomyces orinoci TaxID=67339 RepID=A0ABV3K3F7_STRON|nr:DUF4232 domain-containing protein [Streptomyces orinoci]
MTMRSARRLGAAAAGAVLTLTAAAGLAQAAPSGSTVPTCHTPDLGIRFAGRLGGGMNHAGGVLEFKNTGNHACALRGYPGLGLENGGHRTLPSRTVRGTTWYADDPGNKVVRLRPGATAQAVVAWTHTGTEAHETSYLQVTPPGSTSHRVIPLNDLVDFGELHVTAVAPKVPLRG